MKYLRVLRGTTDILKPRFCSYSANEIQNAIFDAEAERQRKQIGRIEKIEVSYVGRPDNVKILLNKDLSTPHDVARHISDWLTKDGALAFVDGKPWDMHRPLYGPCTVEVGTFNDLDPYQTNRAFWRTCSFLLGAVISKAFKDDIGVTLHSFPSPRVTSGSFIHDAWLSLESWKPNPDELRSLSAGMVKLSHLAFPIERLSVNTSIATEMFKKNRFKLAQIPAIAEVSDGLITLYRVGDHIDISKGPMISNTSLISRVSVAGVHQIKSDDGPLYRFQGVALPRGLMLNHFAYKIIEDRASKLNLNEPMESVQPKEMALQ